MKEECTHPKKYGRGCEDRNYIERVCLECGKVIDVIESKHSGLIV